MAEEMTSIDRRPQKDILDGRVTTVPPIFLSLFLCFSWEWLFPCKKNTLLYRSLNIECLSQHDFRNCFEEKKWYKMPSNRIVSPKSYEEAIHQEKPMQVRVKNRKLTLVLLRIACGSSSSPSRSPSFTTKLMRMEYEVDEASSRKWEPSSHGGLDVNQWILQDSYERRLKISVGNVNEQDVMNKWLEATDRMTVMRSLEKQCWFEKLMTEKDKQLGCHALLSCNSSCHLWDLECNFNDSLGGHIGVSHPSDFLETCLRRKLLCSLWLDISLSDSSLIDCISFFADNKIYCFSHNKRKQKWENSSAKHNFQTENQNKNRRGKPKEMGLSKKWMKASTRLDTEK